MGVNDKLKILIRDCIPEKYQVPVKYLYNRMNSTLEAEMKLLKHLVGKNDRVIDVGGNRGIYSYHLWKLGARVEVFEPNPVCSRALKAWAANKPDVDIHSVGLSNCAGSATLHIPVDSSGIEHSASASIENTGFMHARDQVVQLRTLDSYQFEKVSLVKIDVEGHESSVIEGAAVTIAASKPALLIEIEQRHKGKPIGEILEMILGLGYQGFFLQDGKVTTLKNFDPARHQSMDNFGSRKKEYTNNFLFLDQHKLDDGIYNTLFNRTSSQ